MSDIVQAGGLPAAEIHCTLRYYDPSDDDTAQAEDVEAMKSAVETANVSAAPFEADVLRRGTLGDKGAQVLFLDPELAAWQIRDALPPSDKDYPTFTPHVTVGYDETGTEDFAAAAAPDNTVFFDRVAVADEGEWTIWDLGSTRPPEVVDIHSAVTAAAQRKRKKQKCYGGSPATCKSVKWLAVYRALRDKGYTKEKAARISNSMHNHWKSGIPRRGDKRPLIRKTV